MKRITLALVAALTCLLVASVGTAAAMPTEENFKTTCVATSNNVIGNKVKATVVGKNVAQSQQRYAGCGVVRKVIKGITNLRIEKPKVVEGFRCTPSVLKTGPDVVKYGCLFRGADTATEIRIGFKVTYDMD
jgi:hypothetical protein